MENKNETQNPIGIITRIQKYFSKSVPIVVKSEQECKLKLWGMYDFLLGDNLKLLNLSDSQLDDRHGRLLGSALSQNTTLITLDLSYNNFTNTGINEICDSLHGNTSLRSLNLLGYFKDLQENYTATNKLLKNNVLLHIESSLLDSESTHLVTGIRVWMAPTDLKFSKHRRRDFDPDISVSYKGSSHQIAEYTHCTTNEIWIAKIPGDKPDDLLKELLGANIYRSCGIIIPLTFATYVPIENKIIEEFPTSHHYAIASKKVCNLQLFGESFINNITNQHEPQQYDGNLLRGFWEMLAVAKWIGDIDCLGATGKNAGYIFGPETDKATTYKIDAGGYGWGFTIEKFFTLNLTKHIVISPQPHIIHFDSVQQSNIKLFLKKIYEICQLIDFKITLMTAFEQQNVPKDWKEVDYLKFLKEQRKRLCNQRDVLKKLYQDDFFLLKQ